MKKTKVEGGCTCCRQVCPWRSSWREGLSWDLNNGKEPAYERKTWGKSIWGRDSSKCKGTEERSQTVGGRDSWCDCSKVRWGWRSVGTLWAMIGRLGDIPGMRHVSTFLCCHLKLYGVLEGIDSLCGFWRGASVNHRPGGFRPNSRHRILSGAATVLWPISRRLSDPSYLQISGFCGLNKVQGVSREDFQEEESFEGQELYE